jgi:hypothetical protein
MNRRLLVLSAVAGVALMALVVLLRPYVAPPAHDQPTAADGVGFDESSLMEPRSAPRGPKTSGGREQHQDRVIELMRGAFNATSLPTVAADVGEEFDYAAAKGRARPQQKPCECPPGDPLCSCL